MADSSVFGDVPWYTSAKNWVSGKVTDLVNFDIGVFNKVSDYAPPQALGPAGAVIQGARTVNKNAKVLSGNASSGIRLPGTFLDKFLQVPDADYSIVKTGDPIPQKTAFTDTLKNPGGASHADSGSIFPNIPFWVKTAIVASVVIGTVLIVKGTFNET